MMMFIITLDDLKKKKIFLDLNLGQAEKNYAHIAILFSISKLFPEKLVFKGGTCLMICHNIDRFSEDLYFDLVEEIDLSIMLTSIKSFLSKYNITIDFNLVDKNKYKDIFIYFYGPLFKNTSNTRCKIRLDVSVRKDFFEKFEVIKINSIYDQFPSFYLKTLTLNEIFSEKVRAIITRNKARDLYDLNFLINKGINFDISLINKKLSIYNLKFNKKEFLQAVKNKKGIYDKEMKNLVKVYPEYIDIYKSIFKLLKTIK